MPDPKIPHLDTAAATTAETYSLPHPPSGTGSHASSEGDTTLVTEPVALPKRIGRYEIKRLIGSGGMGAVYEAVQDQPRRTVALKVMRSAVASPMALRRFEYESQLLAKLRHPGIAQVYDAGTHQDTLTLQSVPYFAMEYIPDARSLTAYAEGAGMPLRARLELFLEVCDAVHHGHQRGVIHRDLKPANILVDQQGAAKIIDFGVARSAEPEGGAGAVMTQHTTVGQLVGTLQYMAPEQCGRDTTDIDLRADVYALGVTLYQLLTGQLPYELAGRSLAEAIRIVREVPPTPPSARRRELRGDLETIILKALEKEPSRRFDSASALAGDITRFLKSEPILARRIGVVGKTVRWVRRNRAVATVGGVALIVLATTSIVLVTKILNESRRANANLLVAQDNLARANDNLALMRGMFDSMVNRRGVVEIDRWYDEAVERLDSAPPAHPAAEADFREFLGRGFRAYGLYPKAVEQQRKVVEIRQNILPDPSQVLADSLHELGRSLWFNGQYDEAAAVYSRSLAMRKKLLGDKHPDVATSITHLAACRLRQGQLAEAEDLYKQALEMRQELLPGSAEVAASMNNLAKCVLMRGDTDEAERLFRQALDMVTAALGPSDQETAFAAHNLAAFQVENGKPEEARVHFEQALKIRSAILPPTNHLLCASRLGLARARFLASPGPEPVAEAVSALACMQSQLAADHPDLANASIVVGRMYMTLEQFDRAVPYLQSAVSIYKDPDRGTQWDLAQARLQLGLCLQHLDRRNEAEAYIEQSIETLRSSQSPHHLRVRACDELVAMYLWLGRADDAERVRGILMPGTP